MESHAGEAGALAHTDVGHSLGVGGKEGPQAHPHELEIHDSPVSSHPVQ